MSGFWESELGEVTGSASDAFTRSFTQIPDGTMALARIESFVNVKTEPTQYQEATSYLLITWVLTDGDFKGSNVEQKLKVFGDPMAKDPAKARHRALNMLKLIYQLYNLKPKHSGPPTDQDLSIFTGKIAGIKIRETEPNQNGRQYNWVSEIHEAKGFKCETGISIVVTHTNVQTGREPVDSAFSRQGQLPTDTSMDDDVPF